ncbi:hypothetical protein M3Y95_00419700 [Aphelenchoides besseyi]|nr:hypothetical protein M3Y95_00419700 [Aphelenchoides besseyi]
MRILLVLILLTVVESHEKLEVGLKLGSTDPIVRLFSEFVKLLSVRYEKGMKTAEFKFEEIKATNPKSTICYTDIVNTAAQAKDATAFSLSFSYSKLKNDFCGATSMVMHTMSMEQKTKKLFADLKRQEC